MRACVVRFSVRFTKRAPRSLNGGRGAIHLAVSIQLETGVRCGSHRTEDVPGAGRRTFPVTNPLCLKCSRNCCGRPPAAPGPGVPPVSSASFRPRVRPSFRSDPQLFPPDRPACPSRLGDAISPGPVEPKPHACASSRHMRMSNDRRADHWAGPQNRGRCPHRHATPPKLLPA